MVTSTWPTSIDDGSSLPVAADRVKHPLTTGMSSNQLIVPMGVNVSAYPSDGGTVLIGQELIRYNSTSGFNLVVDPLGRGYHGTVATTHATGDQNLLPPSADAINAIRSAVINLENAVSVDGIRIGALGAADTDIVLNVDGNVLFNSLTQDGSNPAHYTFATAGATTDVLFWTTDTNDYNIGLATNSGTGGASWNVYAEHSSGDLGFIDNVNSRNMFTFMSDATTPQVRVGQSSGLTLLRVDTGSTAERDATSALAGHIFYNYTTAQFEGYGSSWGALGGGGGVGTLQQVTDLGATTTNTISITGSGNLEIDDSQSVILNADGSADSKIFAAGSSVFLQNGGTTRLSLDGAGITVTDRVSIGAVGDGNLELREAGVRKGGFNWNSSATEVRINSSDLGGSLVERIRILAEQDATEIGIGGAPVSG